MNAARYVVALAATSLIALTGCGDTYVAAPEPGDEPAVESNTPAATTAHNPVVVPPADGVSACPGISTDGTSSFIPDDWSQWCDGVRAGALYLADPAASAEMCDAWVQLPDYEILDIFLQDGGSRSYAIGMLDALWMVCAA